MAGVLLAVCLTLLLSACASQSSEPPLTAGAAAAALSQPAATPLPSPPSTDEPVTAPAIRANAAILLDEDTGQVYYALNADTSVPMASTTKIMTALVALRFGTLDQRIPIGADAAAMNNGINSVAGVQQGETLTLRDLLYALMLPSGDDAAVAIADGVAGSQDAFVRLMNTEAFLLGLTHTHFSNPTGLDAPGHYTSARDLATLAHYALADPTLDQIVSTPSIVLPATADHGPLRLANTNELLPSRAFAYDGATGVKTGYTGGAGDCLVFSAAQPGGRLLGVVLGEMGDSGANDRFTDATALLDWGFAFQQQLRRTRSHAAP